MRHHSPDLWNPPHHQMQSNFSAVLLGNLNDFIAPGQACVNPIFVDPTPPPSSSGGVVKKRVELSFDFAAGDELLMDTKSTKGLIKLDNKSNAAKVSLSDCLACSGCVTTAETVLLKAQSVSEFLQTMEGIRNQTSDKYSTACVTLAPQVLASLATRFNTSVQVTQAKLYGFLKQVCGVDSVLDASGLASYLSQLEVAKEFVARYRAMANSERLLLPMLSSSCPGWVCYAEKTLGRQVLDHLSEIRSPQQVAGILLKSKLARVYHVSIMPCPDKKLEASRTEFKRLDGEDAEVNCVLTATELCDLLVNFYGDLDGAFANLPVNSNSSLTPLEVEFGGNVEERFAGNSGSLCAFVFRYACRELFGVDLPADAALPFKRGRNADTWTLELEMEGRTVLNFATSYGFRNIQEVGRKVRHGLLKAHFVEVMACPSGCVNGGGLVQTVDNKKELTDRVTKALDSWPRTLPFTTPSSFPKLTTTFNDIKHAAPANELMQEW
ncbi:hypothetical protein BASA81_001331 [Batrachochytrium salamandrivorans]|nr:hypothetical protein BASA81_001331 [Batrachochytrium salamandrivorans]